VNLLKSLLGRGQAPAADLQLRHIHGNLTFTASTVTAWYVLPERVWAFRADSDRETFLTAVAGQYAGLAGHQLHLRRTTGPYPTSAWAADLYRTSTTGDPRGLADHLRAAADHIDTVGPEIGLTMLGVSLARRTVADLIPAALKARFGRADSTDRSRLEERVDALTELLAPFGLGAAPATPKALSWLIYRSIGLGLPAPDMRLTVAGPGDILALTEHVDRHRTPYGSTVRLVDRLTGAESYVAVLTVGRMEELEIPQRHEPWLHLADQVGFPVEISSRVDVLGPADTSGSMSRRLLMIRSQQRDYADHDLDVPPELARTADHAVEVGDEITTGRPVDATRVHGWHRLAVAGRTERDALDRVHALRRWFEQEARIALQHPKNQPELAREFIPGEPAVDIGYVRRMPVTLFAAAVPQAAAEAGDARGDLIGFTAAAGGRPVMFDPHYAMEVRERSGLTVLVAEPGGGKSTLMGAIGYLAARRGIQVTLLDPSGPLARLAGMPALQGRAKVVNLVGSTPGTLAPYALIPTPRRGDYPATDDGQHRYEIDVANARAERRMLVQDIAAMLLPPQVARTAEAATALRHAARQIPAEESSTLDDFAHLLAGDTDVAVKEIGRIILDAQELPLARLLFGHPQPGALGTDAPLTVITMGGLRLPDMTTERDYWSAEELLALPMLHLAHRLAVRRCYGGDMHARKLVGLDEAHVMEGWRSGRSFLVRLARDSRKWNLAALVASQNPKDILDLDVQNLVTTALVGRVAADGDVAGGALKLLRLPTESGYEETLAALSQQAEGGTERLGFREFVMRDVDGRVQKIRVDVSWAAGLLERLDTTPGGPRALSSGPAVMW
jgi:hypothetical protein